MPILEINKMKVQTKWQEIKDKAWQKTKAAVRWIEENPEAVGFILTAGTIAAGGIKKVCSTIGRQNALRQERYNKERYIYDRSLGMYLHTRRPLTNRDFERISVRRKNGERLADILYSMGILD